MKIWVYYLIAAVMLLHPHFKQKVQMLYEYFTHPEYHFWTTFGMMDLFDLFLHGGVPLLIVAAALYKQIKSKKND